MAFAAECVGVAVDVFVQLGDKLVEMGNQVFNALLLAFMDLFETVFLGGTDINQLAAAFDQCFEFLFGFAGRNVEHIGD